ncbi:MAG: family 78 glycoside hydrolase catalytic domain [Anaerolineales bacterium]|nr:family 78 glycoside hydrolase catalytic domain [Anaerolineales bacterium]
MANGDTRPTHLRCEYAATPLGVDRLQPRLGWRIPAAVRGQRQTAYQVLVSSDKKSLNRGEGTLWDSGRVNSDQSIQVTYQGSPLRSRSRYYWKVRVWDKDGKPSEFSEPTWFETGMLARADWTANWIELEYDTEPTNEQPCPVLRREFGVEGSVTKACAYVSALGMVELHLNGQRVGDHLLAPEWTDYHRRVQYQTYDVTEMVRQGANTVGAMLGYGWYAGRIGLTSEKSGPRHIYGNRPRLLVQLEIQYADGRTQIITSDDSWRGTLQGPIVDACILDGERQDARRTLPGWDMPGFDDSAWSTAKVFQAPDIELVSQYNEPIRVMLELKPIAMTEPAPGVFVFDMGQNMVGWCRLEVQGPRGACVTLRHAELLQDDGQIYTENLRQAAQRDDYILSGDGTEVLEPHFTYHGFRYVEVTGLPKPPALDDLTGRVFYSSSPAASTFECSEPMLEKLVQNTVWTQRGNMHSTPTDCPQRNERLGWMGDAQLFSQAACFNMDMARFFTKWAVDIRDAQSDEGAFSDVSPNPFLRYNTLLGAPAWADAGVIIPWRVYLNYADKEILKAQYVAAKAWVDYVHRHNDDLIWRNQRGNDYGDWLNADTMILENWPKSGGQVPKEVFATAFFAHSTDIVSKMAAILGDQEGAEQYGGLFQRIKIAFNEQFVNADDGTIYGDTQAGYALALHFDLLPPQLRGRAVEHIIRGIERYGGHLSTGIHSANRMMLELVNMGRADIAYQLLMLRTVPSWGYMIDQGATTIWERWDGYVAGRGVQNAGMNSYNHYAIGAVVEWLYRYVIGINPDINEPGYKHILIRPTLGGGLTHAKGTYESIHGPIATSWSLSEGQFELEVSIPGNTTATVYLPTRAPSTVLESGNALEKAEGVEVQCSAPGCLVLKIGAGQYRFTMSV